MKVRAAVLAKRQLVTLLIEQCGYYLGKTDANSHKVFNDIVAQYNLMVDQACTAIAQIQGSPSQATTKHTKEADLALKKSQLENQKLQTQLSKAQAAEKKKVQELD